VHILFVCTGNICRSPIAERLAVAYAARSRVTGLKATSAGTHALSGHPIQPDAARVIENLGGQAAEFAARQLTPAIAANADLVLTMTTAHRDDVLRLAPQQLHRTFTLEEAARLVSEGNAREITDLAALRPRFPTDQSLDIPDPIGQNGSFFAIVGTRIAELIPSVLELGRND